MIRRRSISPVLAVLGLLSISACSESPEPAVTAESAPLVVAVAVAELQPRTWQGSVNTFGVVEALEEVNVAAELSGTVKAVHVNEGDRVEAGQLLLELDPRKREFALTRAQQQVQQSRANMEEARLKLQRRRDLAERESVSREILDNAQLTVDGATAGFQQAMAAQQLAERELADTRIYSPTPGTVDVQAVEAGEPVQAGATLVTLQAMHGLRVHTWVSEADILHITAGGKASVSAAGLAGKSFQANIEWVGVNADPATGNFPVKLIITDDTSALRPGMTASAVLDGIEVSGALLLPEAALVDRDRRRVVFVVEHGVARLREPLLAAGFSNRLHIIDGLAAGERVVIEGQALLRDGTPVQISGGN